MPPHGEIRILIPIVYRYAIKDCLVIPSAHLDPLCAQLFGLYNASYNDFFALGFFFWDVADGLMVGMSRKFAPAYALTSDFAVREAGIQMTQR